MPFDFLNQTNSPLFYIWPIHLPYSVKKYSFFALFFLMLVVKTSWRVMNWLPWGLNMLADFEHSEFKGNPLLCFMSLFIFFHIQSYPIWKQPNELFLIKDWKPNQAFLACNEGQWLGDKRWSNIVVWVKKNSSGRGWSSFWCCVQKMTHTIFRRGVYIMKQAILQKKKKKKYISFACMSIQDNIIYILYFLILGFY